jgi:hypothetical protein
MICSNGGHDCNFLLVCTMAAGVTDEKGGKFVHPFALRMQQSAKTPELGRQERVERGFSRCLER